MFKLYMKKYIHNLYNGDSTQKLFDQHSSFLIEGSLIKCSISCESIKMKLGKMDITNQCFRKLNLIRDECAFGFRFNEFFISLIVIII